MKKKHRNKLLKRSIQKQPPKKRIVWDRTAFPEKEFIIYEETEDKKFSLKQIIKKLEHYSCHDIQVLTSVYNDSTNYHHVKAFCPHNIANILYKYALDYWLQTSMSLSKGDSLNLSDDYIQRKMPRVKRKGIFYLTFKSKK